MKKKISAELAAERGELLGEPYTPPGRTATFDIPAYDDIADLHELFKRFANTTAGVSEAGFGGFVDKTANFTVDNTGLGKSYVCNSATVLTITIQSSPANGFSEGDRFNIIQGGTGKAQVTGSDVVGISTTGGQYEGITVVRHDGQWWCLPFGSSSGGSNGPIPIFNTAADLTLAAIHSGGLVAGDASAKNLTITVPADDKTIPIGTAIVVSNVGTSSTNKVTLVGAAGVTLQDRANANITRWKSVTLVKRDTNIWLLAAGGGQGSGSAPTPPRNAAAAGVPGSLLVTWDTPADDGGHTIVSYTVEWGTATGKLDQKLVVDAAKTYAQIEGLTAGTTYFAQVKATNSVGTSDPSAVVNAKPTSDFNDATGGTEVVYSLNGRTYKAHIFENSSQFVVKKAVNPFDILVIGGGGRGGGGTDPGSGGGGAGGFWEKIGQPLTVKSYAVTVGAAQQPSQFDTLVTCPAGGTGGSRSQGDEGSGGASGGGGASGSGPGRGTAGAGQPPYGNNGGSANYSQSLAMGGGGGGAGAPGQNQENEFGGGAGGAGRPSDIPTGKPVVYATGGTASGRDRGNGGNGTTYGDGGGGSENSGNRNPGRPGLVAVRYEIAPFNSATGGQESDYYDSKTGTHYKVHKFTSNDVFKVKAASRPFRIFVQGGGAGGGYGAGGGRGAANDSQFALAVQDYTITVGAAVSGGYDEHTNRDAPGNNGNRSAVEGVVSSPGGISRGDYYAAGVTTDITGTPVTYGGAGGRCVINEDRNEGGFPGGGLGGSTGTAASVPGGGGGGCQWTSGSGARGEVIISYEIAK